ncbi:MAG TPA: polysaccharide pyruvyl transferase family protein [Usitatibacter sp.]|nr:polysaccharide pyruvyl transferase family protein [Usitatibacter sp.]
MIEYAAGLPQAPYSVVTPYLVPPGPKKVNVGDGFILDSATKLLGARPAAAFTSRAPLSDADIERINATRALVAVGANTLKDDFELTPGFDLATLARIKVPVILMGVGHYGVAELTRGLKPDSQALFRAFLERFPMMSVRCDASRRYVLSALPDLADQVLMTSCPVSHAVDAIDRGFPRKPVYEQLVVTITDRVQVQAQLGILHVAHQAFPAKRNVLALHQDYGNASLWDYAKKAGYEVFRGDNHQDFLRLYETTDMHFGNRVHAHLKCLSLGVASFCTPFDLRQAYFAESLDFPLVQKVPDPILSQYDFTRARARRDAARGTMDLFTTRLKSLVAS